MKVFSMITASLALFVSASAFGQYFEITVDRCFRPKDDDLKVMCEGKVRNPAAESSDDLITPSLFRYKEKMGKNERTENTKMYSYDGDVAYASGIKFGSESADTWGEISHRVPGKLPVKFRFMFSGMPSEVAKIARLDLIAKPDLDKEPQFYTFEDITID